MEKPSIFKRELPKTIGMVVLMMMLMWGAMFIFGGAVALRAQSAIALTSGPTVSSITDSTAVVTWTTSAESTTVVRFGTTEALSQTFRKIVPIEETEVLEVNHSMTLWDLDSDTLYYYQVLSVAADGVTAGASVTQSFMTASAVPECEEDAWSCGEWDECSPEGTQTRTCTLMSDCPTIDTAKPDEAQACEFTAPEEPVEPQEMEPILEPEPGPEGVPEPTPETEPPDAPPPAPEEPEGAESPVEPLEVLEPTADEMSEGLEAAQDVVAELTATILQKEGGEDLPDEMRQECGDAGVPEEMCYDWMSVKISDRSCLELGFTTVESCEAYLAEQGGGVFPGCEGLTDAECDLIKQRKTAGYLSSDEREQAEEIIVLAVAAGAAVSIPEITPIRPDEIEGIRWRESFTVEGTQTSSAVLTSDADGDGLPDQLEEIYGSDPNEADSDSDGVVDAEEVVAGEDPAGEGSLERELSPTEQALAGGQPIGQPRGSGVVDEGLGVASAETDAIPGAGITLTGKCDPGSICLVYVYTYVPMVYVATTDDAGNFTLELGNDIMDGEHTVYVALTDDTGKIERKSSPLSLFVREATAVTESDYLSPFAVREEALPIGEPVQSYLRGYIIGAIVLVALALLIAWLAVSRKNGKVRG